MTHEAAIKIAPLLTLERFDDPKWRSDRTMYESGSLRFLPGMESVPLIVNHDDEWVIGTVHELFKMDWIDGPWIAARCTVDTPPVWMKRNTRASFGFKLLHRREVNIRGTKADVVATALVTEVSILPDFVGSTRIGVRRWPSVATSRRRSRVLSVSALLAALDLPAWQTVLVAEPRL